MIKHVLFQIVAKASLVASLCWSTNQTKT